MLDANIFNTEKVDYGKNKSLFFGEAPGLFDTVNRQHPGIWEIYKNMKSLDWDELEFGFASCNAEFKTRPASISDRMIKTLAWQWEADSVASRTILPIMAPFISSPELQAAWGRITDNEVLHATTYSEIVRYSFDDPQRVLQEVLEVKEAMLRLKAVSEVMATAYRVSHEYALGMREADDDTYEAVFMFVVALLALERIQFMASFAVTFAIGEIGAFMPIAKAVQKICQDEFECHVALDKYVLRHEMSTERGARVYERCKPKIEALVAEVVDSEIAWVDTLLGEGEPLVGLTASRLKGWVYDCAADVYRTLKLKSPYPTSKNQNLPFMNKWVDISKTQASPQEQENGQYKVNIIQRTDEGKTYDLDF